MGPIPMISGSRAETALVTAGGLPEKLLSGLRDEDLDPAVLGFYAHTLSASESALQIIALRPSARSLNARRPIASGR